MVNCISWRIVWRSGLNEKLFVFVFRLRTRSKGRPRRLQYHPKNKKIKKLLGNGKRMNAFRGRCTTTACCILCGTYNTHIYTNIQGISDALLLLFHLPTTYIIMYVPGVTEKLATICWWITSPIFLRVYDYLIGFCPQEDWISKPLRKKKWSAVFLLGLSDANSWPRYSYHDYFWPRSFVLISFDLREFAAKCVFQWFRSDHAFTWKNHVFFSNICHYWTENGITSILAPVYGTI